MKNQRILIAIAWVLTVVSAYFIGGFGNSSSQTSQGSNPNDKSGGAGSRAAENANAGEQRTMLRKGDELLDADGKGGKANVVSLIARARAEMGSGMGGMMNIRGMLRAIAPLAELDPSQLQEALAEVEKTVREPQQRMMFYSLLLGQWAETDGKAAMAYAKEKLGNKSPFDMGVTSQVLGAWARTDPDAAWRWYQTEPKEENEGMMRGMTISVLFAGMSANNLDTALTRLATLDDQTRAQALSGIAMSAQNDTARRRLLDRAASLPPEQRAQIQQGIVGQWAMMDSEGAVKWIRSLPPEEQKPLRSSAGSMMMMSKPAMGAELMLEGADEKERPGIYDRIVGQWGYQDPKGAGEWLSKQPQGPELDGARRSYAMVVSQRDPAAAMDWASSVRDPEQRSQSVEQVYQQWRTKDANAANAALDKSGLPAERIKELMATPVPEKPINRGPFAPPAAVRRAP
jgi:hypothetical protein